MILMYVNETGTFACRWERVQLAELSSVTTRFWSELLVLVINLLGGLRYDD